MGISGIGDEGGVGSRLKQVDLLKDDTLRGKIELVLNHMQMEAEAPEEVHFMLDSLHLVPGTEAKARVDCVVLVVDHDATRGFGSLGWAITLLWLEKGHC